MVAEVETIVRSIEDEKIQKEERDKTRDVFARIEQAVAVPIGASDLMRQIELCVQDVTASDTRMA